MRKNISFIVPVYNAKKWLPRCIDSIILCMNSCDELILIDDGSTDGSQVICDTYASNYVNIRTFHQKNAGESCARNSGIEESSGEWIFFVDADDFLDPESKRHFERLDSTKDMILYGFAHDGGECQQDIGDTNYKILDFKNKKMEYLIQSCFNGRACFSCDNPFNPRSVWGKLFRNEFIKRYSIEFHKGVFMGEDFEFMIECYMHAKNVEFRDCATYRYFFRNTESITNRYKPNLVLNTVTSRKRMAPLMENFPHYQSDYENYLLDMLILHLRDDFFHPDNHMRWHDKKEYISNVIDQGGYKKSYEIATENKKIYHYTLGKRMMFWIMVNKKYCAMWIAYCIRYKLLKRGA